MAGTLDGLVAAAVRAWATAARTWIETANAILIGWLELGDVESGQTGFNTEFVVVPAQPATTGLHPGRFANWDHEELPPPALAVAPPQVNAGEATKVCLLVKPPKGTASGTYTGSLCAPSGAPLIEDVGVYVVGDTSP
jgi:hypothetical protein